jgi:glycosyltransferase involved in cell wall biosynthesis
MDIFCLPSYREGLPRTIIEAMMMGKPVIASNIRGCREQVISDITGILVPSKNSIELKLAINKLLIDKDLRISMGKMGREKALRLYDEKYVIKLQIDNYGFGYYFIRLQPTAMQVGCVSKCVNTCVLMHVFKARCLIKIV